MSVLDTKNQRTAFTDALRPPPGFVLGAGIGTTFSLEFDPFTAVLLAFVGADTEDPVNDAPSVLTTVARLRSRLRVFVDGGGLHPPNAPNRLFALYDRILRRKTVKAGAFHPKVWALRFDPVTRPERHTVEPIYRVLTASRNVTDSGCWELGARFEGMRRACRQSFGSDVSDFCRKVTTSRDLPATLLKLMDELRNVEFAAPREAAAELRFDWQWPDDRVLMNRLPKTMARVLIISPFVRADFLTRICRRTDNLILVSTQDELDRLSDDAHDRLSEAQVFVVVPPDAEDMPSLELHAKLLAWESTTESATMVGSANATGAGWGGGAYVNCEAMVSLRPGLGINAIAKAFIFASGDQLHPWIEKYRRQLETSDPETEITRRLENFKRLLCSEEVRGEYNPDNRTLRLLIHSSTVNQSWPAGIAAEIIPLLQRDQQPWADYRLLYEPGAVFTEIHLQDVAAFACISLRAGHDKDNELTFVVQFELNLDEQEADERDRAVNARLLEGIDARSLLVNVLTGLPGGMSRSSSSQHALGGPNGEPLLRRASIESILEACTADPSRIDEVEAVLSACGDAQDMAAFREFWSIFKESLQEGNAGA